MLNYELTLKFLLKADMIFDEDDLIEYYENHEIEITEDDAKKILNFYRAKCYIDKEPDYYVKGKKLLANQNNKQTKIFSSVLENTEITDRDSAKKSFLSLCDEKFGKPILRTYVEKESENCFNTLCELFETSKNIDREF